MGKSAKPTHQERIEEIIAASEWILDSIETIETICRLNKNGDSFDEDVNRHFDVIAEDLQFIYDGWEKHFPLPIALHKAIICAEKSSDFAEFHLADTVDGFFWPIVRRTCHRVAEELISTVVGELIQSGKGLEDATLFLALCDPIVLAKLLARLERESILLTHFLSGLGESGHKFFEKLPAGNSTNHRGTANQIFQHLLYQKKNSGDMKSVSFKDLAEQAVREAEPGIDEKSNTFERKVDNVLRSKRRRNNNKRKPDTPR